MIGIFLVKLLYILFSEYSEELWSPPSRFLQPRSQLSQMISTKVTEPNNTSDQEDSKPRCATDFFKDILLIVGFGYATEYESIPLFELLYKGAFRHRAYCGNIPLSNESDITINVVNTRYGAFLFECLSETIKTNRNYSGYLFVGEDVLLNYWNLLEFDRNHIWESESVIRGPLLYEQSSETWEWWQSPWGVRAMEKVYEYFIELNYFDNRKSKLTQGDWTPDWDASQALNTWLWNGEGDFACYFTEQSVVYLPHSEADLFVNISKHFRASGVRHDTALPTIIRLMRLDDHIEILTTERINDSNSKQYLTDRSKLVEATKIHHTVHIGGSRKERRRILNDLRMKEYAVGKFLEYEHCR